MALEAGIVTSLRIGTQIAAPPRARALEAKTYPMNSAEAHAAHNLLRKEGAITQSYVSAINWMSIFADEAQPRNPRSPFLASNVVMETLPLSHHTGSAIVDVLGAVTGPYVETREELHSMFLVSREEKHVPTFAQLSEEELTSLHHLIGSSLTFLDTTRPENTNFIGMSISPMESLRTAIIPEVADGRRRIFFPRSPVQNLRSVHMHVVSRNEQTVQQTEQLPTRERRMLHEPFLAPLTALLRETVLIPVSQEFPGLSIAYAENVGHEPVYPKGAHITISESDFQNPEFALFMKRVSQQIETVYFQLAETQVDKQALFRGEVIMKTPEAKKEALERLLADDLKHNEKPRQNHFAFLPDNLKHFLLRFVGRLQNPENIVPEDMPLAERAQNMQRLALLGPAYNVMYYRQNGKVTVSFTPRVWGEASPAETAGFLKRQQAVTTDAFQPIITSHTATTGRMLEHLRR